jgi:hypothetical protein
VLLAAKANPNLCNAKVGLYVNVIVPPLSDSIQ